MIDARMLDRLERFEPDPSREFLSEVVDDAGRTVALVTVQTDGEFAELSVNDPRVPIDWTCDEEDLEQLDRLMIATAEVGAFGLYGAEVTGLRYAVGPIPHALAEVVAPLVVDVLGRAARTSK